MDGYEGDLSCPSPAFRHQGGHQWGRRTTQTALCKGAQGGVDGEVQFALEVRLAVAAAAYAAEAALLVEARLLALGAEEAPIAKLSEYAGALHGGLEAPEQGFGVFAFA